MSRLIDEIRRLGNRIRMPWYVAASKEAAWRCEMERTVELLRSEDLPVIVADNVAAYYWEASGQERWDLRDHFPNIAPPYPAFWVEHRFPRKIHSDELGDMDCSGLPRGRTGWLLLSGTRENVQGQGIPDDAHWVITAQQFIEWGIRKDDTTGPPGTMALAVTKEGRITGLPCMQTFASEAENEAMRMQMAWLFPIMLTVCFLHCKNVQLTDNHVPPKLAKKYREKHGITPTSYKTLVIEPLKAILRSEGRSGEVGVPRAMHICRGHFKDYRQGKGLFGKYHQLVWHDAVVRGTKGEKAPPREIEVKV